MKPSDITAADLAVFSRQCVDLDEYEKLSIDEKRHIQLALGAARGYVRGYAGLDPDACELEDVTIAILTIGAEMLDNRQMTAQYTAQNPMVMQILDLHSTNLLPTVEGDT